MSHQKVQGDKSIAWQANSISAIQNIYGNGKKFVCVIEFILICMSYFMLCHSFVINVIIVNSVRTTSSHE